jgi:hypothetical protein
MNAIVILLRLVHIVAGVFWVGALITMTGFIQPAAKAIGPDGGKFMQQLVGPSRLSFFMSLAAPLTTLAGLALYWLDSGFRIEWILTPTGLGFTIGGLTGIAALLSGFAVMKPTSDRVAALGKEMQTAGGPPSPTQVTEMQALQEKMRLGGRWVAALLVIAVIAMAIARYL